MALSVHTNVMAWYVYVIVCLMWELACEYMVFHVSLTLYPRLSTSVQSISSQVNVRT